MVIGEIPNHEKLATQIATFMDTDATEPSEGNIREGWTSDAHLRKLESVVMHENHQNQTFADIAENAGERSKSPAVKILLKIGGQINGLRRMTDKEPIKDEVDKLIREAAEEIDQLEDGTKKERLDSLLDYNAGEWNRVMGNYDLAAELKKRSATKAETSGDRVGASIGYVGESVQKVNEALVNGDQTEIAANLEEMISRSDHLIKVNLV